MGRADESSARGAGRDATGDEGSSGARRVAWGVVMVLGCAFSYSLGWQKGWVNGTAGVDVHLSEMNRILLGLQADVDAASANRAPTDAAAGGAQLPQASL